MFWNNYELVYFQLAYLRKAKEEKLGQLLGQSSNYRFWFQVDFVFFFSHWFHLYILFSDIYLVWKIDISIFLGLKWVGFDSDSILDYISVVSIFKNLSLTVLTVWNYIHYHVMIFLWLFISRFNSLSQCHFT